MAFTWTEDMGAAALDPAIEGETRAAIIAGAAFLDALPRDQRERLPRWNQGEFASPVNAPAQEMEAAIVAPLKLASGLARARIVSLAVRMAILVFDRGGGEQGWRALAQAFPKAQVVRGKLAAAAARPR